MTLPKLPLPNSEPPSDAALDEDEDDIPSVVRRFDAFKLLASVAEKALVLGRSAEAERLLATPLSEIMDASRAKRKTAPELVDQAARFAAKLATTTGKGAWVDYAIEIYSLHGRPCAGPVVDELYNALRKATNVDINRLRAYAETMRAKVTSFGPADRFLFQRIEGLERIANLK